MKQFLAVGVVAAAVAASAQANIRITEVMSSSTLSAPTPDWIEVTNYGSSSVSLASWRIDDGSFNFAASALLNGVAPIDATPLRSADAAIPTFLSHWALSGIQVGYYSGSGLGFSSGGDGACLFDSTGAILSQVSFGAATNGSTFYYGWDAAGVIDPSSNGLVSVVGTIGSQVTTLGPGGDTGSLGTTLGVIPAPGAIALLGLAGLAGRRRR